LVDQLVKLSFRHEPNSDTAPGSLGQTLRCVGDRSLGFDPRRSPLVRPSRVRNGLASAGHRARADERVTLSTYGAT
jgi:hypothetical protein